MTQSPIEEYVDGLDQAELTDLVFIASQQDPTESKPEGGARWNAAQREIIMSASTAIDEAGL